MTQTPQNRSAEELNSSPTIVSGKHNWSGNEWVPDDGRSRGTIREATATLVRPNNTTAYGALTHITNSIVPGAQNPLVFNINCTQGYVVKARLVTNSAAFAIPLRLWLYRTIPTGMAVDGASFPLLYANKAARVGFIDFPTLATEGGGSDSSGAFVDWLRISFAVPSGVLLGLLETRASGAGSPPIALQEFFVELGVEAY